MKLLRKMAGFICILMLLDPGSLRAAPAGTTTKSYRWLYNSKWYIVNITVPDSNYTYYRGLKRTYSNYADYVIESSAHPFVGGLAQQLRNLGKANRLNDWQTVNMIVKFVQSITYQPEVGEYPRFPIETIVDAKGDCEDSAILLAAILSSMGYEVILVSPPGHMAVAAACSNCEGTYYEQDNKRYFYIETTDNSWPIGRIPPKYDNKEAKLYKVTPGVDSGSMLGSRSIARSGDSEPDDEDSYTAYVTINGVTYRLRLVKKADGGWAYE